ncbi:MAG: YceI family protein [Bacteroidota bacterium]|jgi:polyisoprenoid-binding protein YceI
MRRFITIHLIVIFGFITASAQTLRPVPEQSSIQFTIKNMGFPVSGTLSGIQGVIQLDLQNPSKSDFQVSLNSATINTRSKGRDNHIRKDDFLSVLTHPEIKFKSTKITVDPGNGQFQLQGILTIKGVSKPITFPFQVKKEAAGFRFTGSFSINRLDFNVGESSWVLSSNVVVQLDVVAVN